MKMARRKSGGSRWRALATALLVGALVVPILQVLLLRFVNPPFTLTMFEEARLATKASARFKWVVHENRSLEQLGENVARAAVASEDARFFFHRGFDWEGICTALRKNERGGKLRGGSTISQQVARNVFLWQGRSYLRKGLEAWYTLWLELLLPKDRILEVYLNIAETGKMTFGFEAGAWRYYRAEARTLSLEQAAHIASLLPSPRKWTLNGAQATERAAWILEHPAPFPKDPGFDEARAAWARSAPGPLDCFLD
jgi:monofunctional biosynthetic peptidoglycan transglycosylase